MDQQLLALPHDRLELLLERLARGAPEHGDAGGDPRPLSPAAAPSPARPARPACRARTAAVRLRPPAHRCGPAARHTGCIHARRRTEQIELRVSDLGHAGIPIAPPACPTARPQTSSIISELGSLPPAAVPPGRECNDRHRFDLEQEPVKLGIVERKQLGGRTPPARGRAPAPRPPCSRSAHDRSRSPPGKRTCSTSGPVARRAPAATFPRAPSLLEPGPGAPSQLFGLRHRASQIASLPPPAASSLRSLHFRVTKLSKSITTVETQGSTIQAHDQSRRRRASLPVAPAAACGREPPEEQHGNHPSSRTFHCIGSERQATRTAGRLRRGGAGDIRLAGPSPPRCCRGISCCPSASMLLFVLGRPGCAGRMEPGSVEPSEPRRSPIGMWPARSPSSGSAPRALVDPDQMVRLVEGARRTAVGAPRGLLGQAA